jgi:3-isopropylmalate/(R)-2-methylmalate dehydratase small subunit
LKEPGADRRRGKKGSPCVVATAEDIVALKNAVEADPTVQVTIDLDSMRVRSSAGQDFPVVMPDSARDALISGRWDPIQELLDNEKSIEDRATKLGYV